MGFSRQEYWSGLPPPLPGARPNSGTEPTSTVAPTLQADSLSVSHRGSWKPARAFVKTFLSDSGVHQRLRTSVLDAEASFVVTQRSTCPPRNKQVSICCYQFSNGSIWLFYEKLSFPPFKLSTFPVPGALEISCFYSPIPWARNLGIVFEYDLLAPLHVYSSCPSIPSSLSPRKKESEVTQSSPTLCDPMDCNLPGSSVHGIFQARILKWVAISFSRRSSQPRDRTPVSHYDAADALPSEPPGKYRWTPVSRSPSQIWSLSISAATIPSCLVRRNYFEITLPEFPSLWGDPYFTLRRFLSYTCNPVTPGAEHSAWPSFPVEVKSAGLAPRPVLTAPFRTISPFAP